MGIKRYELSETQWTKIAPLLPGKAGVSFGVQFWTPIDN
jgi:hypothetical protein